MEKVFCVNCRHRKSKWRSLLDLYDICTHPATASGGGYDYVTGKPLPSISGYCDINNANGECQYYEPKAK